MKNVFYLFVLLLKFEYFFEIIKQKKD